jgi:ketopantoate reductase
MSERTAVAEINCAEACQNGCVLGARCPNLAYREQASNFVRNTSMDRILAIAEARTERLREEARQRLMGE